MLLSHEGKKAEAESLCLTNLEPGLRLQSPDAPPTPVGADWHGKWKNSRGETGEEPLSLKEKPDGTITGVLAWSDISVPMWGDRLGKNTFVIQGGTEGRYYRCVGIVDGGRLLLHYSASRLNVGGAYYGRTAYSLLPKKMR